MRFNNEYRETEAYADTRAHAIQGMMGMATEGTLKKCIPHNSHVALGLLAAAHPSPLGQDILASLSHACQQDPEFAQSIWNVIRQEVLRDESPAI